MREVAIVSPVRTAVGNFGGALKDVSAAELGATVIKAVLERTSLDPDKIDEVILGHGYPSGEEPAIGRLCALKAGLPIKVPGYQLDRRCSSGLQSILNACMMVQTGNADVVLAGGVESMSRVEFYTTEMRSGSRFGSVTLHDRLMRSRATASPDERFGVISGMIETAENLSERHHLAREEQDAYALRSHQRAAQAMQSGFFLQQIVPVMVQAKKETIPFTRDEHVRPDTSLEKLARLPAVFKPNGMVTAGNASGINDAAALMLVTTAQKADELRLPVAGRLVSYAVVAVDPAVMGIAMIPATRQALQKAGLSVDDIAMFEVNEAYADVALYVGRELEIPEEKLNPVGGAVALGHPIGASGAILVVKLLHELERQQARYGLATLCIGGGMGIAAVFERPS